MLMLIGIGMICTVLVAHQYGFRGMIESEVRAHNLGAIGRTISSDSNLRKVLPADDIGAILHESANSGDIERIGRIVSNLTQTLDPSIVVARMGELESDCPGIMDALTSEEKNIYDSVLAGQEISKKQQYVLMQTLGI